MAGKSPVVASAEQKAALRAPDGSRDRGEADRARAVLLTLSGWTSPRIAQAFGVREDTVRLWRRDFARGGVAALKASPAPGPAPVKAEAALRVVTPLLERPVADRPNWTLAVSSAKSRFARASPSPNRVYPRCCAKKVPLAPSATHPEGSPGRRCRRPRRAAAQTAKGSSRGRRHRASLRRRKRGADPSLSGPSMGQTRRRPACAGTRSGQEDRDDGGARSRRPQADRAHQPNQANRRLHHAVGDARQPVWPEAGCADEACSSCSTTARSMRARRRPRRCSPAPTGSPSSGCPNTRPNSTTSRLSGTISRLITLPTRPSPTPRRLIAPSMLP